MLKNKKIFIIRANALDRETRATKIIRTLSNNGYFVSLISWNRNNSHVRSEKKEAGNFQREIQFSLPAPLGMKILLYLPIWWSFIFIQLMFRKWDLVHAIQITSLPPAILAGKLKRKPVIYDMLDTYEDSIILPTSLRNTFIKIDKLFMRCVSGVVLADEDQINEVNGIPNCNVITIYDSPTTIIDLNFDFSYNDVFTLFFVGSLDSGKKLNLDKVFEAIKDIDGVKLVIGGYGNLVNEIEEWAQQMPEKVQFIGEISHFEVIERSSKADLLFVLRDPILLVNKYICGSKILEAMMCGKPILVNKGTSTANKVLRENCGLLVDAKNVEEIKNSILKLKRDSNLCREMGENAKKAYDKTYNWKIMEKNLLSFYSQLVGTI